MTNAIYCDFNLEMGCAASVATYYLNETLKDLYDAQCLPKCPLECSSMTITYNTQFTPGYFTGVAQRQMDYIQVVINFNDLAYTESNEEPEFTGKYI